MGKNARNKKKKKRVGLRSNEDAQNARPSDSRRGHAASEKVLQMLLSQWPALMPNFSPCEMDAKKAEWKDEDTMMKDVWAFFDSLTDEEKVAACTVSDPSRVRMMQSVVASRQFGSKGVGEKSDGLFLAIQAPGREERHFASTYRTWEELSLRSVVFKRPTASVLEKERALIDIVRVYDGDTVGSRSLLTIPLEHIGKVKDLLKAVLQTNPTSGKLASVEVRTGDDDDYNSMTDPSKQVGAYEKLPSCLFSGSIGGALAYCILQSILTKCVHGTKAPGVPEPLHQKLFYLAESLPAFLESSQAKSLDLTATHLNLLRSCESSHDVSQLFSCSLSHWLGEEDDRLQGIAEAVVSFHSQKIALDLVRDEQTTKKAKAKVSSRSTSCVKSSPSASGSPHQAPQESVAEDPEVGEDQAEVGVEGEREDTGSSTLACGSADLVKAILDSVISSAVESCDPSATFFFNLDGGQSEEETDNEESDESDDSSDDKENGVSSTELKCDVHHFEEATEIDVDEDGGEWEKVQPGGRKARRASLRQAEKTPAAVSMPVRTGSNRPRIDSRSSAKDSSSPYFGPTHIPRSISASELHESSSILGSTSGQLPPVAPRPVSGQFSATRTLGTALNQNRRRNESMDTMSLSSVTSASTMYEENNATPSSWPSRLSNLNVVEPATHRSRNVTPEGNGFVIVQHAGHGVSSSSSSTSKPPTQGQMFDSLHFVEGVHPSIVMSLHSDIQEMATMLEQIAVRRHPWQMAVSERIKALVESLFPGATANVFGSLSTGLAAPCSDVDMVVQSLSQHGRNAFRTLSDRLRHESWVQMIQPVEHSAVPVIRLSTAQIPISFGNQGSLINVDITFDNFMHRGLRTSELVKSLLQMYPPLKPLALVLKQFLVEKGLNDPFVGGLSSYGLVIMITAILQKIYPNGMSKQDCANYSLGALFVEFLREYATTSFLEKGVFIFTPRMTTPEHRAAASLEHAKAVAMAKTAKAPLYILDPLDIQNNVGRSCFGIHQLIHAFAEALEAIQLSAVRSDIDCASRDWSILGGVFATGHHRHVVNLVTQVWCPRENPVSHKPAMKVHEWAITAKSVLEALDTKSRACPWCNQKPHAMACTLKSLLQSFPSLNL